LRANGEVRVEVDAGASVRFDVVADVLRGGIVGIEWDFDGLGLWSEHEDDLDGTSKCVTRSRSHVFLESGTYFPAVRVWLQRDGDGASSLFRIPNLGRTRVVVRAAS
jgi:hypothetical protein